MQWLKVTVPDPRVCIPTPACVIVAVRAACAFPEKQSYLENFRCIEIFLSFRIFEQLALAPGP